MVASTIVTALLAAKVFPATSQAGQILGIIGTVVLPSIYTICRSSVKNTANQAVIAKMQRDTEILWRQGHPPVKPPSNAPAPQNAAKKGS
jgi:hypothetical protein